MSVNLCAPEVLLLNLSWEPIRVITIKHAVNLMFRNAVYEVDGIAAKLKTVSGAFVVPSILRTRRYVSAPRLKVTYSRSAVLKRDGFSCIYCGKSIGEKVSYEERGQLKTRLVNRGDMTLEHIIPISQGGKSTWSNTACACSWCNRKKGNRTAHQAHMALRWEPKRPRTSYLILSGSVPSEWKAYIDMG